MPSREKITAILIIISISGYLIYNYVGRPILLGTPISQLKYEEIEEQTGEITISAQDLDFDLYGNIGNFFQNLSFQFYETLPELSDIPFVPPINPDLAPEYTELLNSIIFNVTPADPPKYWKMSSYDYYTGKDWTKTLEEESYYEGISPTEIPTGAQVYKVYMNITHELSGSTLIPIISPYTLIINNTFTVEPSESLFSFTLTIDSYNSVIFDAAFKSTGESQLSYNITYQPIDYITLASTALTYNYTPSGISSVYTQLPGGVETYLADKPLLAGNVSLFTAYANTHSVYDTALQVLSYFKGNFIYNPFAESAPAGVDPVEWFFEKGEGTSQDFATAYTVFLRCLGISARLTYGFLPGEQVGDTRVIRTWNTHFWSEVYVPNATNGEGIWIQCDPTPLPSNIADTVGTDDNIPNVEFELQVVANGNTAWVSSPTSIPRGEAIEFAAKLIQNGEPLSGYIINFYDYTENIFLGTAETDANGWSNLTIPSYNDTNIVGPHTILAYPEAYKTVQNYTVFLLEGETELTLTVTPQDGENVTRAIETLIISGTLKDKINGQPIVGQTVDILFNNTYALDAVTDEYGEYSVNYLIPVSTEIGNLTVNASFSGDFKVNLAQYGELTCNVPNSNSTSPSTSVIVLASSKITTEVNETAVTPGDVIRIYGFLSLDNNTALAGQTVNVYWLEAGGSPTLIETTTDGTGYYYIDYTIPEVFGEVKIYSEWESPYQYILGAYTDPVIYVGEEKVVNLDVTPTTVSRGSEVAISGYLIDNNGNPIPDTQVFIQFYSSTGTLVDVTSTTTDNNGYFSTNYIIPTQISVGLYKFNVTTQSQLSKVSEEVFVNVTSSTYIKILSIIKSVAFGENISLEGRLLDDLGNGIPNMSIEIYLENNLIYTAVTNSNGIFTLENYTVDQPGLSYTLNLTLYYGGDTFYSNFTQSTEIYLFTEASIEINTVEPSEVYPGGTVIISGIARDNVGRGVINRTVLIYLNDTIVGSNLTNVNGEFEFALYIPENISNCVLIIHGELLSTAPSTYQSKVVNVLETIDMQIPADVIIFVIIVASIGICVYLVFKYYKKRRSKERERRAEVTIIKPKIEKLKQLIESGNLNEAVLYAYKLLVNTLEEYENIKKSASQTLREYAQQVIAKMGAEAKKFYELTKIYEEIRYSKHSLDAQQYKDALNIFIDLYNLITGGQLEIGES
ncbi:MAG: transglutaminase domain-containing protein [Candidatus Odinarchaeia archaeon]